MATSGKPPPSPLWPRPGPGWISLISRMGNSLGGVDRDPSRYTPPSYFLDLRALLRAQKGHRIRSCWGMFRSPIFHRMRPVMRILIV